MKVGAIDIVPVHDGTGAVPANVLYAAGDDEWLPHRQFLDDSGQVPMEVGGFLIRGAGDSLALVDLGLGPLALGLGMGHLMDSLAALGVQPSDVTDVLFTHLHLDHIGWAVVDGAPAFPNATYRCASQDWSYFVDPGGAGPSPIAPVIGSPSEAGVLGPVPAHAELWAQRPVLPGIDVAMAPGHTPGSTVIVLSSRGERALLLGDVVHCPVELVDTEWEVIVDVDPELARRTRESLAREYEGTDVPMAAAHFADMRFGRILPGVGTRRWVFA
jgi:glyoxylase-like metal-dependent hydrolase (beta-lactamase superfamily II)